MPVPPKTQGAANTQLRHGIIPRAGWLKSGTSKGRHSHKHARTLSGLFDRTLLPRSTRGTKDNGRGPSIRGANCAFIFLGTCVATSLVRGQCVVSTAAANWYFALPKAHVCWLHAVDADTFSFSSSYVAFAILQAAVWWATGTAVIVVLATASCGCFASSTAQTPPAPWRGSLARRLSHGGVILLGVGCIFIHGYAIAANNSQTQQILEVHANLSASLSDLWQDMGNNILSSTAPCFLTG